MLSKKDETVIPDRPVPAKMPRVLLMLSVCQKASRDRLDGILAYAREHGPWEIQAVNEDPFFTRLGSVTEWHPDGIICSSRNPAPPELRASGIPTVFIKNGPAPLPRGASSVRHDDRAIGADGARFLLAKDLPQYAYIGQNGETWSAVRGRVFTAAVKAAGKPCSVYRPKHAPDGGWPDWAAELPALTRWILRLPKPCGLMVACDMRAFGILSICLANGLSVPNDLCILGVDNNPMICETTHPTLSSVEPDFVEAGRLAAKTLDHLMSGRLHRPVHLVHGDKGVIERESSLWFRASLRVAGLAREYIRLRFLKGPVPVLDIAHHLHVSRRLLEMRFREAYGESILTSIQNARIAEAKRLIRETHTPFTRIAEKCGYISPTHFENFFRHSVGMSMSAYYNSVHPQAIRADRGPKRP